MDTRRWESGAKAVWKTKSTHGCDLARQPVPFAIEERPVFVRFQHVLKGAPRVENCAAGKPVRLTSWSSVLVAVRDKRRDAELGREVFGRCQHVYYDLEISQTLGGWYLFYGCYRT